MANGNGNVLRDYITDKGKEGKIYNNFIYREVKKRAADGGIFWRCINKACAGRMKTDEDKEVVFYDGGKQQLCTL
jgi:hypothetical protein